MNLPSVSGIGRIIFDNTKKYSPEILTGLGVVSFFTATVLAVKVTPKAHKKLEKKKAELGVKKLPPVEVVKTVWKDYAGVAAALATGTICTVTSDVMNYKQKVTAVTACGISEAALKTYQEKVVEEIGEKKEKAIRDKVAEEKIKENPISNAQIVDTGRGEHLFYDTISGRYFKSDIEKLRRVAAELNSRLTTEMYISLNEFYFEIGLSPIKIGDDLGWNINDGMVSLDFSSQLTSEGVPCGVLDYCIAPRYDFRALH